MFLLCYHNADTTFVPAFETSWVTREQIPDLAEIFSQNCGRHKPLYTFSIQFNGATIFHIDFVSMTAIKHMDCPDEQRFRIKSPLDLKGIDLKLPDEIELSYPE